MVMHPAGVLLVGGSNPDLVNLAPPPPPPKFGVPGFEPPTGEYMPAALPLDQQLCASGVLPRCLEPYG